MAELPLPGFDPDEVREGIRLAMQVGLPVEPDDQPTFVFAPTFGAQDGSDAEGTPFDWRSGRDTPAAPARAAVKRPCAIEYDDGTSQMEAVGAIYSSRLILTLLDEDYEAVKGFSHVLIGGNSYTYELTEPPLGLVSVGVWRVHVRAEDEG